MVTAADVATLFLKDIGAPVTPGNVRAVSVWLAHENSNPTLRNNPWNLHSWGGLPGQTGSVYVGAGDRNVAVFGTLDAGVLANARNLLNLSKTYPQYGNAVAALRADNPTGFLTAIAASPWSAGHYRINGVAGTNSLLRDYNGTGTYGGARGSSGITTSATGHASTGTATLSGAGLAEYQTWLNRSLGLPDTVVRAGVGGGASGSLGDLGAFASDHPVVWVLVAAAAVALLVGRS